MVAMKSGQRDASMIYIELPDKAGPVETKEELRAFIDDLEDRLCRSKAFIDSLSYGTCIEAAAEHRAYRHVFQSRQHPASPVLTIPHFGRGPAFTGQTLFDFLYG